MPITFSCPSCSQPLVVADDQAGVTVACPACKKHLRAPSNGKPTQDSGTATNPAVLPFPAANWSSKPASGRSGPPYSCKEWSEVDAHLGEAVEVVDRRQLTGQEEAHVRASLTTYANSVPHHDVHDLGKHVRITHVREFRSYQVTLDSLFEKRQFISKEQPFQGKDIPAAKTTEANIQVWNYSYPSATDFRKSTQEHVVDDSQSVRLCNKCGGQKALNCDGCKGRGAVRCPACCGSGTEVCKKCKGDGHTKVRTGTQQRQIRCDCYGGYKGNNPCLNCQTRGWYFVNEDVFQVVPCACGTGTACCSVCNGRKQINCSSCSGSGRSSCSACNASGKMISYLCVVQSFDPHTQTSNVPFNGIREQTITGMVQPPDFAPFLTLPFCNVPASVSLSRGAEAVQAGIMKAFSAARERNSNESRLTRQRLQMTAASILEVVYEDNGTAYTAWIVGKQARVHAPVNPITDALKHMVEKAVTNWKKGDQEKATLQLRDALDMAKANQFCQRAYDGVCDTIPAELQSKARWHRWKPFLIGGAVVFAGAVVLSCLITIAGAIGGFFRGNAGDRPNGPPGFKEIQQPAQLPKGLLPFKVKE